MATDKKGGAGPNPQNPQNGGMRERVQGAGQQIREGAEQVSSRLQEGFDSARQGVASGYRQVEGTIARNPTPSLLIGFGLGFGLGIVLCQVFGHEEETWTERNISGPLRRGGDSVRDTVKQVPDHVHHLADAILSHLPEAIKRRIS